MTSGNSINCSIMNIMSDNILDSMTNCFNYMKKLTVDILEVVRTTRITCRTNQWETLMHYFLESWQCKDGKTAPIFLQTGGTNMKMGKLICLRKNWNNKDGNRAKIYQGEGGTKSEKHNINLEESCTNMKMGKLNCCRKNWNTKDGNRTKIYQWEGCTKSEKHNSNLEESYTKLELHSTMQNCMANISVVQYSPGTGTEQYSTVQYSTVQYSTVQYSTVQYSTVLNRPTKKSISFCRQNPTQNTVSGIKTLGFIMSKINLLETNLSENKLPIINSSITNPVGLCKSKTNSAENTNPQNNYFSHNPSKELLHCFIWSPSAKVRNKKIKATNGNGVLGKTLRVTHWNLGSRHWKRKVLYISQLVHDFNPDLAYISEANLHQSTPEHETVIPGYSIHNPTLPNIERKVELNQFASKHKRKYVLACADLRTHRNSCDSRAWSHYDADIAY